MYTSSAPGPARGRGGNPNAGVPPQQQPQQLRGPSPGNPGGPSQLATAATSRVGEMLDQVKAEYEAAIQQLNMAKMEQLEMERKIQSQVVEMDQIQQSLKALEANHRRIRQQYEEDMMRMRRQLETGQVQQQVAPPQQPMAAKLPAKRSRASPATGGMQDESSSLMSNLVAAATSSRAGSASAQQRGNISSPVRVVPVQPASRSLQQLGQQPPQLPPPPQGGNSNQPPQLNPLDTNSTNMTPSSRRMPSINSDMNGKERAANSPPALKKSKINGSETNIPSLNGNGKSTLTTVSSSGGSTSATSGILPQVSKMNRDQGSASTNSSPSAASANQSQSASSSIKNEIENNETSRSMSNSTTTMSAASGNNTTQKSSNTKASRLNWSCVYSSKQSMSYQESERPAAEMHQSMDHQSVVCCVRFSSDGTMMASGCHKTAQVFDVKTGDRKYLVSRPAGSGHTPTSQANTAANEPDDAYVRAVCFSPDCTKLVAGMPQNTIRIWDIGSNEEGLAMTGHESEIYSLDYVNDLIVSGSGDRKVRLWDARNGQCKKIFGNESGGPSDGVTSVALSPDGRLLAAASLDKVVRIWDTETAQLLDRLEGHSDSVYSIAFSPDGKNVISGSLDRNIMLWDVCAQGRTTTRPRMLFQGHKDFVLSVAYTPDGRWLMSGSKDRSVVFWDPRSSRSVLTLTGYRNSVISVASSPASPYFATGSGDCFAVIWKYQCQTF
ncbi:putative transcriptional repressor Tup1, WD40/YVTN repeat-like-containing domain superfamily [Plasmopara halstedii]